MSTKSARLTQRQWLNIIILVISAMFLLMVIVGKRLQNDINANSFVPVTAQLNHIRKIDFGSVSIEQINGRWQSSNQQEISSELAQKVSQNWLKWLTQNNSNHAAPINTDSSNPGFLVLVYVQNHDSPLILKVKPTSTEITVTSTQANWSVIVPAEETELLIPASMKVKE